MLTMMISPYSAALERAKADLNATNSEIQRLIARKNSLENLVKVLGSLGTNYEPNGHDTKDTPRLAEAGVLRTAPYQPRGGDTEGPAPDSAALIRGEFLWKQIAIVMKDVPKFTISEAGEAVETARGTSMGHTRSQQVRNAIVRHRDRYFRHNPDNTWSVVRVAFE